MFNCTDRRRSEGQSPEPEGLHSQSPRLEESLDQSPRQEEAYAQSPRQGEEHSQSTREDHQQQEQPFSSDSSRLLQRRQPDEGEPNVSSLFYDLQRFGKDSSATRLLVRQTEATRRAVVPDFAKQRQEVWHFKGRWRRTWQISSSLARHSHSHLSTKNCFFVLMAENVTTATGKAAA